MEGHEWVSLGGVGHVEMSEGFFGLTERLYLSPNVEFQQLPLNHKIFVINGNGPNLVQN